MMDRMPHDELLREAERRAPQVLDLLRELVEMESPTDAPAWVALVQRRYAEALEGVGVSVHCEDETGVVASPPGVLVGNLEGATPGLAPLLVVGHLDTVHPLGTLDGSLPARIEGDRFYGPGAYDMKAGLAVLVGALEVLRALKIALFGPIRVLVTSDEEVGALRSRALLEREARGARGALVLEPSLPGGGAKIRRKGIGDYQLHLTGIPAHAGIEPHRGASAIHALGPLMADVLALARPEQGTTLNVGEVRGGTARNVVAAACEAVLDLRFETASEGARVDAALRSLAPADPRVTLRIEGGINRPPLEPSAEGERFMAVARAVAAGLGRPGLEAGGSGGGSDGNLISAVGCPVLDGLGVEGDGAHTNEEFIRISDLPFRIALLAGMLARV
jgi:glutamate carboxypeptidase